MLIRCPKCNSSFNLKREFVPLDKRLRCGACLTIFTLGHDDTTSVVSEHKKNDDHRDRDVDLTNEEFMLQDANEHTAEDRSLEDTVLEWLSDKKSAKSESSATANSGYRAATLWLIILGCLAALALVFFSVESPMLDQARQRVTTSIGQFNDLGLLMIIPVFVIISLLWLIVSRTLSNKLSFSSDNDDIDLLSKSAGQQRNNGLNWVFAIILILLIGTQAAMINSEQLSLNLRYRPMIKTLCAYSKHCDVAELKDTSLINILSKSVVSHPDYDKVLLVTVNFVNNAEFAQAFPKIKLSFFDYRGDIVTRRVFTPEEYMPDELYYEQELQPSTPIQAHLRIIDPGKTAVNYRFELL